MAEKNSTHTHYTSYILRLWSEEENGDLRVRVQHIATGKERLFPNLEEFFLYLHKQNKQGDFSNEF